MGEIDYCSKSGLYRYVGGLKKAIKLTERDYPLNFVDICSSFTSIKLEAVPFKSKAIRGMAVPKDKIILLNSYRNKIEQSFDCGHEFIHLVKHKNANTKTFNCFDTVRSTQNGFLEWQANEGSAELHVPYKMFIPLFCEYVNTCYDLCGYENLKLYLSQYFGVPQAVIDLRIDNLKYEIKQYQSGVPIDKLSIKSRKQLDQEGIFIVSYNAIIDFMNI